jgi:hypothetical protein
MADDNRKLTEEELAKRESGQPGGGQGRRDVVGKTPVYPVSADKLPPEEDMLIRTPGEFGQRGRGLEGYYDHGESGLGGLLTPNPETAGGQPEAAEEGATQSSPASGKSSKLPGAGEETASSGSVDVDQDPPSRGHGDITRF